jgi:hypothetical protein
VWLCEYFDVDEWYQVEILSAESSGVNLTHGSSGFHALSHLYDSVNKWWRKDAVKKSSSQGDEKGTGDSFRSPRSYRKPGSEVQAPIARFTFAEWTKQAPVTLDPPGSSGSVGRPKLLTDPATQPSPLVLPSTTAEAGESKSLGVDGEYYVPAARRCVALCCGVATHCSGYCTCHCECVVEVFMHVLLQRPTLHLLWPR